MSTSNDKQQPSLRDAWNVLQEHVGLWHFRDEELRGKMNAVAGAIAATLVCTPRSAEGAAARDLWTVCVFEGSPPQQYSDWHAFVNAKVKTGVTIQATPAASAIPSSVAPLSGETPSTYQCSICFDSPPYNRCPGQDECAKLGHVRRGCKELHDELEALRTQSAIAPTKDKP